jgi:hypothetical protein
MREERHEFVHGLFGKLALGKPRRLVDKQNLGERAFEKLPRLRTSLSPWLMRVQWREDVKRTDLTDILANKIRSGTFENIRRRQETHVIVDLRKDEDEHSKHGVTIHLPHFACLETYELESGRHK